jgi:Lipocalin-like domain
MMTIIVRSDRPKPESIDKMTDQQRADLRQSMAACAGTYIFDGKRIEHHIDVSWNEVWTGTTVVRDLKKEGN